MTISTTHRILGVGATLALLTSALTACAPESGSVAGSLELHGHTIELSDELAERVPEEWKGGIKVPIQVLRPNAFVDEDGETVGLQPDLLRAIGTKLGIDITLEVAPFDAQIPGVQANQYAFTTATGDFPERRKILTMVNYTIAGAGWLAPADSQISSVDDICGSTIGVAKGTATEVVVESFVEECKAKGFDETNYISFSNTLMTVPLEADRIDITYDSISSVVHFANTESDKFKMIGGHDHVSAISFGVVAGEQAKAELLRDTLQELFDEGVYSSVFDAWGLSELMLKGIYINGEGLVFD